jgi:hypothetical protein
VAALPQPAFFKLPAVAALPVDSSSAHTSTPCRLQLERGDGSRLTLTWPGLDASFINSLVADFLFLLNLSQRNLNGRNPANVFITPIFPYLGTYLGLSKCKIE